MDQLWRADQLKSWNVAGLFEWEGYWIFLSLLQDGGSLEANYLEIRAMRQGKRGKPKPITKPEVLKRLPLASMVEQLTKVYWDALIRFTEDSKPSGKDDPQMARIREWVGGETAKRLTEAREAPPHEKRKRGRPRKSEEELEKVALLYRAGGRKRVIEENPHTGKSTIDHWIRRCRDLGMIPSAGKKGAKR
jgi:hypothetical protein